MKNSAACISGPCSGENRMQMITIPQIRSKIYPGIASFHTTGNKADVTGLIVIIFQTSVVTVTLHSIYSFHLLILSIYGG